MRLIWRRKWGFTLMSYPVDGDDKNGFKAAIMDSDDKIWWFSDDVYQENSDTKEVANLAWAEFIKEYSENHEIFPDGTICELQEAEISEELLVADESVKSLIKEKMSDEKDSKEKKQSSDGRKSKRN